jgi:hypothetical protein
MLAARAAMAIMAIHHQLKGASERVRLAPATAINT